MKKFFFSVVALAGLFLTSCGNDPVQEVAPATKEGKEISLQASMADFTRATDTAFEQGDQIGLFIFNPEAYLSNVAYTFGANGFAAASKQVWYEDETLESQVVAYYPYSATVGTFTVAAAQTSHAAYTASDLMVASTTATPTENAITLPFKHMLSKVKLTVVNETEDAVASVQFANVAGQVAYEVKNAAETLAATGSMTIEAGLLEDGTYTLIMAPQTVAPKMVITTVSGQQYNFKVENAVEFKAGTVSTASVKIEKQEEPLPPTPPTPDPIEITIDWTITDWAEGEELDFVQTDEEVVVPENKIYLQPNANWMVDGARFAAYFWFEAGDAWVSMTASATAGIYECEVPAGAVGMLFCRMNPGTTENTWDNKWNQTADLTVPTDGNVLYIVPADAWDGSDNTNWTTL